MATKAAAAAAPKPEKALVFTWEGTDRKGKRVKGETRAATIALARADMRRQGSKSSLLRAASGEIRISGGSVRFRGQPVATTAARQRAKHLAVLREADLVRANRSGQYVIYSLNPQTTPPALLELVGARRPRVARRSVRGGLESVV